MKWGRFHHLFAVLLTWALCITAVFTGAAVPSYAASISWNFKDNDFKNLGTIRSTITVNDLTLIATEDKTMSVNPNTQTVDNTTYTYCLALGGSGSREYRSVKIPVSGESVIKVTLMSSGDSERSLIVADGNGTELTTLPAKTVAETAVYNYNGAAGYLYLYSGGSGINLYKIQVDDKSSSSDPTDGTIVTNFNDLLSAISRAESDKKGIIYVKGTSIDCTEQIKLSKENVNISIIGLQNSDGSYPVLDFAPFLASYIGTASGDAQVGVRITGSGYTLQNLIIQKAPDNGIQIKGSKAGNNKIKNCIVRYNNDAGLQITGGAYNNEIRFVYSYRNCDVYTLGGNADGFAPKLAAGTGNTFYGCYAWDNSDDGWDSYDKTDGLTLNLSYIECATWNNGNPSVFTGEYDFNNGKPLDTNLLLVQLILKQDPSFAANYANKNFLLPSGNFIKTSAGTISLASWTGDKYDGNPNGFKFGSVNTTSQCERTVENCVSFNHKNKGFDNNNSSCTASFKNCVAFDNGCNYAIQPFTLTSFINILGFSGGSKDKLPNGYSVTTPDAQTQTAIRNTVASTVNTIVSNCENNRIEQIYFDIYR